MPRLRRYKAAVRSALDLWKEPPYSPVLAVVWAVVAPLESWFGGEPLIKWAFRVLTGGPMSPQAIFDATPWVLAVGGYICAFWFFQALANTHGRLEPLLIINDISDDRLLHRAITVDEGGGEHALIFLLGAARAPDSARVLDCEVRMTGISLRDESTGEFREQAMLAHPLRCTWSNYEDGTTKIDIQPGVTERFNLVMFSDSIIGAQLVCDRLPNTLIDALAVDGEYRIEFIVSGGGRSERGVIEYRFGPDWNDIVPHVVRPANRRWFSWIRQSSSRPPPAPPQSAP